MKLLRFNVHEDLSHINSWLEAHKMPPVTRHALPEVGYLAWHMGKPIAACFLRRCEGGLGIVDSLISNPESPGELRHVALDALINHIVDQAKHHKLTKVIGFTQDASTLNRSLRLGFGQSPFQVVVMDLNAKGSN